MPNSKDQKCNEENESTNGQENQPVTNGRIKFTHKNTNIECKCPKCPNQKTQTGKLNKKPNPSVCCVQETHLTGKDTQRLKIKGWRKIYQANEEQKKVGVAILISGKIDFKATKIKRDKEGHYKR